MCLIYNTYAANIAKTMYQRKAREASKADHSTFTLQAYGALLLLKKVEWISHIGYRAHKLSLFPYCSKYPSESLVIKLTNFMQYLPMMGLHRTKISYSLLEAKEYYLWPIHALNHIAKRLDF